MTHRILNRFAYAPAHGAADRSKTGWERLVPLAVLALPAEPVARQNGIVAALARALRAERARARGRHPAYDLARHAALVAALRDERRRLRAMLDPAAARAAPRRT